MSSELAYADRFGHEWQVMAGRAGGGWAVAFTREEARLEVSEPQARHPRALTAPELKELFCDAERVVTAGGQRWYVGYRHRADGRQRPQQGGLCTRFRSESGELRYSRDMHDFRHLPLAALGDRLAAADRFAGRPAAR